MLFRELLNAQSSIIFFLVHKDSLFGYIPKDELTMVKEIYIIPLLS